MAGPACYEGKMGVHPLRALILLAALQVGCTFYSDCPCAEEGNNPSTGGAGPTGGSGGSSGTGGATGGSSGIGGEKPSGEWVNVTANLAGMESECGNLSHLSSKPDEDMLIVGVALHGLWASTNGGESWEQLGQGTNSEEIYNRTSSIIYDPDDPNVFWETGIYNGGGVYRTDDDGDTFVVLGDIAHLDVVSIDFSDPDRQTLLAGPHEEAQVLYFSTDGGETWSDIGENIPSGYKYSHQPHLVDAQTFLVGCSGFVTGDPAILRSTDGGENWERLNGFGPARPLLVTSTGAFYWALENNDGLVRSDDSGETWERAGDSITIRPVELPDGRIATATRQNVIVSDDAGETWSYASPDFPYEPNDLVYSDAQRAFFVSRTDCGDVVLDDAIMRYDFDYEAD